MEVLPAFLKQKKNEMQGNDPWVWIFDLHRDSSNISRYTLDNADVVFDGNTYTPKDTIWEPPSSDAGGTLHPFTVSVGDADLTEMAYLMNGKYRKQRFLAMLVNREDLTDPTYNVEVRAKILRATYAKRRAVLRIGTPDIRRGTLPGNQLYALRCGNRWKDWRCKYAGSVTTPCDLMYVTCRYVYDNETNFFGGPGMPRMRT